MAHEAIYQHYNNHYNKGDQNTTVQAQFHFSANKGTTLVLNQRSNVQFVGEVRTVDSSDFEGDFYKKSIKVNRF